jgi:hypothetical protein
MLALRPLDSVDAVPIPPEELVDILSSYSIMTLFNPMSDGAAYGPYPPNLLKAFFESLDETVARMQPSGRRLNGKDERLLARYCYLLGLFERLYREGISTAVMEGPLLTPTPKKSVEELLAIPNSDAVEDIWAMSWLFYERCNFLLSQPVVLGPVFGGIGAVGGADGDLIVDWCLIEVKASVQTSLKANWLRQLAGYLLLDSNNKYQINSLGIYMARQGLLFTWHVEDFLQSLTSDPGASVTALRSEFRTQFSGRLAKSA